MTETERNIIANLSDATEELTPLFCDLCSDYAEVCHLVSYRIKFLFSHKPKYSKGKQILGSAKVFGEKDLLFHEFDAAVTLDFNYWEENPDKRLPLLFHELCHLEIDEDHKSDRQRLRIASHDIEEFYAVWRRFGDWQQELKRAQYFQLEFNFEAPEEAEKCNR